MATPPAADGIPPAAAAEPQVRAPATEDANEQLTSAVSSLEITDEKTQDQEPLPPHRSHDPQYNQKRTDPFQFGSRYLEDGDDPFEFNAWDHVETDDAYKEYAEQQYEMQRQSPVSDFDKCESFILFYFFLSSLGRYLFRTVNSFYDDLHYSIVHLSS